MIKNIFLSQVFLFEKIAHNYFIIYKNEKTLHLIKFLLYCAELIKKRVRVFEVNLGFSKSRNFSRKVSKKEVLLS